MATEQLNNSIKAAEVPRPSSDDAELIFFSRRRRRRYQADAKNSFQDELWKIPPLPLNVADRKRMHERFPQELHDLS